MIFLVANAADVHMSRWLGVSGRPEAGTGASGVLGFGGVGVQGMGHRVKYPLLPKP